MSRFHLKSRLSPSPPEAVPLRSAFGLGLPDDPPSPDQAPSPLNRPSHVQKTRCDLPRSPGHAKIQHDFRDSESPKDPSFENIQEQFRLCKAELRHLETVHAQKQREIGKINQEIGATMSEISKFYTTSPTDETVHTQQMSKSHNNFTDGASVIVKDKYVSATHQPEMPRHEGPLHKKTTTAEVKKKFGSVGEIDRGKCIVDVLKSQVDGLDGSRDSFYLMADAVARAIVTTLTGKTRFQPYPDQAKWRAAKCQQKDQNERIHISDKSGLHHKTSSLESPAYGRQLSFKAPQQFFSRSRQEEESRSLPLDLTVKN